MTLDFRKTAHDCTVARYLAPHVLQHFDFIEGRWVPKTDFIRTAEPVKWAVVRLLIELGDRLPEGPYWNRTRRRMQNTHSLEAIRRDLQRYLLVRSYGFDCIQNREVCPHPRQPLKTPETDGPARA